MAVGDRLAGPGPAGAASGPLGAAGDTPRYQPAIRPLHTGVGLPAKAALAALADAEEGGDGGSGRSGDAWDAGGRTDASGALCSARSRTRGHESSSTGGQRHAGWGG